MEDEAITGEIASGGTLKDNGFIYWKGEIHDFDLSVEYRISGAAFRQLGHSISSATNPLGHAAGLPERTSTTEPSGLAAFTMNTAANCWWSGEPAFPSPWTAATGSTRLRNPKAFAGSSKPGEWNTYRITAKASHVEIWINGTLFAALDDHQADAAEYSGRLAFQLHSGHGPAKVQFRNIRLAHLGRTALPVPNA